MTKFATFSSRLSRVESLERRKEMMRVMSEFSSNSSVVVPDKQEELASFMVEHLRSAMS